MYFQLFSQENIQLNVIWTNAEDVTFNEKQLKRPALEGQDYDHGVPTFYWTAQVKNANYQLALSSFQTVPAPLEDVKYFQNNLQLKHRI